MANIKRKNIEAAPAPANWHSITVGGLTIYREPQDDSYQDERTVNRTNEAGEVYFRDPDDTGSGWFADGSEPTGWVAEEVKERYTVKRTKRGSLSKVQIVEEDADGNVIPRGKDGYAEFEAFNTDGLRDLAVANPATVGAKYEAAIVALQALAGAIYDTLNA